MSALWRGARRHGEMAEHVRSAAHALPSRDLVLDRYRPLRPLGRGGSGSVWLARDERTGLEVALKIVPREGKRASRAAREMEAASRLRHERCVRAYDFGGDEGHVYIAYEYVAGRTMREALRTGKIDDRQAVEIAAQILEGLAHAHRLGIVHRDVKPSNVLLEDKPSVSARLLDFGLAQFDEADTLTAVGDVPGTLAYISPERLRGGEASAASDVWSVGVLLWEGLAGQHPFWGVPLPQVAAAIEAGAPPLASLRPDIASPLLAAVSSALRIEPERRPPAESLAADLRSTLSATQRDRARPRRHRAAPQERVRAQTQPRARGRLRLGEAMVPAGATALTTAAGATLLPFWTPGLVLALALVSGLAALRSPRAGLAIALFAPLFPFGNLAQGAALAYGAFALGWLTLCWRDARAGLLFLAGPLLAPLGGLALLPLAVQRARGPVRRGAQALAGVMAAALAMGLRGLPLPLSGAQVGDLGLAGSEQMTQVAAVLLRTLQASPTLTGSAVVLAAAAVALPHARRRGLGAIALLGVGQIAGIVVAAPSLPIAPIVIGTCFLCLALGAVPLSGRR